MARSSNSAPVTLAFIALIFVIVVMMSSPKTTQGWLDSLQKKLGPKYDVRKPGMKLLDVFGQAYMGFSDRFGRQASGKGTIRTGTDGGGVSDDPNAGRFYPFSMDYLGTELAGTGNTVAELLALGWDPSDIAALDMGEGDGGVNA